MKKYLAFALFFSVTIISFSQMRERTADEFYNQLAFKKAVEFYEPLASGKNSNSNLIRKTAECYRYIDNSILAEEWYKKLIGKGIELVPDDYYHYGQMLKANEKYLEANEIFKQLHKLDPKNTVAKEHVEMPNYISKLKSTPERYNIEILSSEVNSPVSDFGTAMYNENGSKGIIFASTRKSSGANNFKCQWDETNFMDTYIATLDDQGEGTGVKDFGKKIRSKFHEGPVAFNPDYTEMYLTRSNYKNEKLESSSDGINKLKIYIVTKNGDEWDNIQDFPYNSNDYSVGHATISLDGKTLYFVSDMPGGYGESDIWMCKRDGDTWTKPVNLGDKINSEAREMFPYIGGNGVLYFSTDGHVGMGGLDLFRAQPDGKDGFQNPSNMGYPLNTNKDDFAFIVDENEKEGYFSSNRNTDGAIGSDDIYRVRVLMPFGKEINGFVSNCDDNEKIGDVEVVLLDKSGKEVDRTITSSDGSYTFYVDNGDFDVATDKEGYRGCDNEVNPVTFSGSSASVDLKIKRFSLIGIVTEDKSGKPISNVNVKIKDNKSGIEKTYLTDASGMFNDPLSNNKKGDILDYTIKIEKDGYFPLEGIKFSQTINGKEDITIEKSIALKMQKIETDAVLVINNIYFNRNEYLIRTDAAVELDKIASLLNKYPSLELELRGHTDCREHKDYNMWLSRKRAQFSMNYIRKKISNKKRITAKWFGETQPVNDCDCEGKTKSNCSEEQHQQNRRTEFKVIKFNNSDVEIK